jgi:hypothetical protein
LVVVGTSLFNLAKLVFPSCGDFSNPGRSLEGESTLPVRKSLM